MRLASTAMTSLRNTVAGKRRLSAADDLVAGYCVTSSLSTSGP